MQHCTFRIGKRNQGSLPAHQFSMATSCNPGSCSGSRWHAWRGLSYAGTALFSSSQLKKEREGRSGEKRELNVHARVTPH